MGKLTDDEITEGLAGLAGWARSSDGSGDGSDDGPGDEIAKEFRLGNFKDAVAFVVRLSFEAEAADHHPDLDIRWNRVLVRLSTHSEGGITAKDLDLAAAVESLAPTG